MTAATMQRPVPTLDVQGSPAPLLVRGQRVVRAGSRDSAGRLVRWSWSGMPTHDVDALRPRPWSGGMRSRGLHGYARVLLTVNGDGSAEGQLLGGTVSFMSARTHAAPAFGNPAHWAAGLPDTGREARHAPERITAATEEAFHLRFLAQCAVPDAQMTTVGDVTYLVDVVTGSAATLTPTEGRWEVREGGPVRLWERIEAVLSAYDAAGRPGPEAFTLHVDDGRQQLRHRQMPSLPLPRP